MPTTSLIVLSDLHLADNLNALEGFYPPQQAALEGLLHAALPGGSLGTTSSPMLILNGDTFDLLAVPPYPADGFSTPQIGLEKLEKIAAAHEPFLSALRNFLDQGGNLTFLAGNHDIELCFAEVRARLAQLIDPTGTRGAHLSFCLDQHYRPAPDVLIEHGNQYDFWNYASGIWDQDGRALTHEPQRIELPLGTQYMQRAALPVSLNYPYFDRFAPPIGIARQIALLSLLDPALVVQTAQGIASMMSNAYQPLQGLASGAEYIPERLFTHAMTDFAAFQQDMLARVPTWSTSDSLSEHEQQSATFFALHAGLAEGLDPALQVIFEPPTSSGDEDTTRGMQRVLREHPALRVAVAGHTHATLSARDAIHEQLYLNTATWTQRLAPPTADELTPAIMDWLRSPDLGHAPLTNKTAYVFAWISTQTDQPSSARLCVWEGGNAGSYRVL